MNLSQYNDAAARMKHGCLYEERDGVGFFRAAQLKAFPVKHGFTARKGGVSAPPMDTLNLGLTRDEPMENIMENFRRFCVAAELNYADLTVVTYEHGSSVLPVTAADRGRGFDTEKDPLPFSDGITTNDPRVVLTTSHADCGAYFVYDPVHRAVGLAHAGWKGTLRRIGTQVLETMLREYGTRPQDTIVSTGPCICRDCFEVDLELAERFAAEFGLPCHVPGKPGKAQLDLEMAAAVQFLEAGVLPENITLMQACTYELSDRLFSYRRDKGHTGSMSAYLQLV